MARLGCPARAYAAQASSNLCRDHHKELWVWGLGQEFKKRKKGFGEGDVLGGGGHALAVSVMMPRPIAQPQQSA